MSEQTTETTKTRVSLVSLLLGLTEKPVYPNTLELETVNMAVRIPKGKADTLRANLTNDSKVWYLSLSQLVEKHLIENADTLFKESETAGLISDKKAEIFAAEAGLSAFENLGADMAKNPAIVAAKKEFADKIIRLQTELVALEKKFAEELANKEKDKEQEKARKQLLAAQAKASRAGLNPAEILAQKSDESKDESKDESSDESKDESKDEFDS